MRSIGFILSLVVVIFSAQPLIPALAQEQATQEQDTGMSCCNAQTDCFWNSPGDSDDTRKCDSEQGCTDKCQCITHSQTVNAIAGSWDQLSMFGVYIEERETLSTPYHLILPVSIWHPPQS